MKVTLFKIASNLVCDYVREKKNGIVMISCTITEPASFPTLAAKHTYLQKPPDSFALGSGFGKYFYTASRGYQ